MAKAITWRSVQAESQRDALLGQAQALQNIQQGIGGLGGLFKEQQDRLATERLNEEQAALDNVLNRISGINTVEGLDAARENQLIANSGLTDKQQLEARNALNTQTSGLLNRLNARNTFDTAQANREKEAARVGALKSAEEYLNFNLLGISRSRDANKQVSEQLLKEAPYLADGLSVAKDGTLQLKSGLTAEQRAQYAPALEEANQLYSSASSYGNLTQNVLNRALSDPNIGISDVSGLLGSISAVQALDPVYKQQQKDKALRQELTNLGEQSSLGRIDRALGNINQTYPDNPAYVAAIDTTVDLGSALDKFSKYAQDNDQYFAIGRGDEAGFRKNTLSAVNKFETLLKKEAKKYPQGSKSRDFLENYSVNGGLLDLALSGISEVVEAKKEGNLGDSPLPDFAPEFAKEIFRKIGLSDEVTEEDVLNSLKSFLPDLVNTVQTLENREQDISDLEARRFNVQAEALKKRAGF